MSTERLFDLPPRVPREVALPEFDVLSSRIYSALNEATVDEQNAGLQWYGDAHALCCQLAEAYPHLKLSPAHVAGIIAVLSPVKSWEQNIEQAIEVLETGDTRGLGHSRDSAQLIRFGFDPTVVVDRTGENLKVQSFYRNIAMPEHSEEVTLDRHMWTLMLDDYTAVKKAHLYFTRQEYAWGTEGIQKIAANLGIMPHQLQAITWLVQRRRSNAVPSALDPNQEELDFTP